MFRQWKPTTCWETWSAKLIWSAALCSSVSYLKRTALPAWHNPNTVLSPFSRGSREPTQSTDLPRRPIRPNPHHHRASPNVQPTSGKKLGWEKQTHDTNASRFLIGWKARAPVSPQSVHVHVCACICAWWNTLEIDWNTSCLLNVWSREFLHTSLIQITE